MSADLRPYPEYRDSGLPWLGRVPAHWSIRRAKGLYHCIDVRSDAGAEELLTVSAERGVVPRNSMKVTMFKAASYVGHKLCWPNDLVINSLWAWGRGLGVTKHHGIISSAYGVYRLNKGFEQYADYIHHLVRSAPFHWELRVRSKGVWISRLQLTDDTFLDAPIPLPSPDEAEAIVRFVAAMESRINRFIRNRRRLIEVLSEQKQAIINRAVTRGLDPNVPLKPSGIDWLGGVPEHWKVIQMRRRWSIADCKHLTVPFVTEGVPVASVREVQAFHLKLKGCKHTTGEWYASLIEGNRAPQRGDLVYCRNVSVGACAYVDTDESFAMGQDVCLIRSKTENQRFLNYFLHSGVMRSQLAKVLIGSTFNRINVSEIKSLIVALPPRMEQDAIVASLDTETRRFEQPIEVARHEIDLIREYRTRLTADVVTGKVDVRHLAPAPGDEPVEPEELAEGIEDDEIQADDEPELVEEVDDAET